MEIGLASAKDICNRDWLIEFDHGLRHCDMRCCTGRSPAPKALTLQRPLADSALRIVARGGKADNALSALP